MDYNLLTETAVLAGEIMLKSGAETYRVEDTMKHILRTADFERVDAFALLTGIIVTLQDKEKKSITITRRVTKRATNMNRIVQVNDISRRFCGEELTLDEAYAELTGLKKRQYGMIAYNIAVIGIVMGFALMFGGSAQDILATGVVGILLAAMLALGKHFKVNDFIMDVAASVVATVAAIIIKAYLVKSIHLDLVIISSFMPLVTGVAITNAVRDTLQGDYLSGGARIMEAFLKAIAISLGVGIGIAMLGGMMGGAVL